MIKVFLVEDEIIIRKSIKNNIHWEENGFAFVGEASDGEMALPLILQTKPDVVITDIRMPFMDGLELSRQVKNHLPNTIIVILSGYGEFDYAKEAIKIGVTDYLSKPVTEEQLMESMEKIKKKMMKKNQQRENAQKLKEKTEENRQSQMYQLLGDLIRNRISVTELLDKGTELGISLMAPFYNFMLMKIFLLNMNTSGKEFHKYQNKIRQLIEDQAEQNKHIIVFHRATEGYVFMIKGQDKAEIEETVRQYIREIERHLKGMKDVRYFIGVGSVVERMSRLSYSYDCAGRAFMKQYNSKKNEVVYYDQMKEEEKQSKEQDFNLQNVDYEKINSNYLENFLQNGEISEINTFVKEYIENLGRNNMNSFLFCQYILINIQICILHFMEKLELNKEELKEEFPDFQGQMMRISSRDKAEEYIIQLIGAVLKLRNKKALRKHSSLINEAQKYIRENYQKETLSLSMIASEVGLSTSHFSTVFRQETGQTFVEYLTFIRMEKAKELLKCTDMKASEIGYEVGYKDPHYFSYLFKKTQDCTPRQYRMRGIQ